MNDADKNQNASGSWQPDPTGRFKLRWRNETGNWTDHVYSSEGEMGNDPYETPPPPPPPPPDSNQNPTAPEQDRPSLLARRKAVFDEREAERKAKQAGREERLEAKKAELKQRLEGQKTQKVAQREALKSASGKEAKLLVRARPHLDDDETPLCSVLGTYETKRLGSDSVRSGILIATDKRVVFYAKKATGHDINFFRYKAISSIDTGKNMMGAYITLVVSGNEAHLKWISGDAAGFVETVQDQMESV